MSSKRHPRLDQLLASLGYGSRREVELLVKQGRIKVKGVERLKGDERLDPSLVSVDGQPLDHPNGVLIMLHKPLGVVCSHNEEEGQLIYDLLPERWRLRKPQVVTVGRLDKDTSGLILLTDDHDLVHRLTSPKHHVPKVYHLEVEQPIPAQAVELFQQGTLLLHGESKPCLPAKLTILTPFTAELELHEGKYHQVRRMMAAVGCKVIRLHRASFGSLSLGELKPGEHRAVDKSLFT